MIDSTNGKYNEVLVVGKPNIRTYEGYNATQNVKVCGIYCHQMLNGNKANDLSTYEKNNQLIEKLLKANPGLTVFKEFTWTGNITMKNADKIQTYVNTFK